MTMKVFGFCPNDACRKFAEKIEPPDPDTCQFCGDPAHPLGHPDDDPCTRAADEEERDLGAWEGTFGTEEWAR